MKRICPKCGNNTFITTAHVMQDWLVDAEGNYLETSNDCVQVDHKPNPDNTWSCGRCGAEAVEESCFPYNQDQFTICCHYAKTVEEYSLECDEKRIGNNCYISVSRRGYTIDVAVYNNRCQLVGKVCLFKQMSGTLVHEIPFILECLFGEHGKEIAFDMNPLHWYELTDSCIPNINHLVQYEPNGTRIWTYIQKGQNSCGCGSRCFHYEEIGGQIRAYCNACNKVIGEPASEERCEELRSQGIWR